MSNTPTALSLFRPGTRRSFCRAFLILSIRWADRPRTPPFQWGLHGEEVPQHDAWLTEMDFTKEPLVTDALPSILQMDTETAASYSAEDDCRALHEMVIAAAGAIQAAFLCVQSSAHGRDSDKCDRLSTTQFRSFIHVFIPPFLLHDNALHSAFQSVSAEIPAETCDDVFHTVTTHVSSTELEREDNTSLDFRDFIFALIRMSSRW